MLSCVLRSRLKFLSHLNLFSAKCCVTIHSEFLHHLMQKIRNESWKSGSMNLLDRFSLAGLIEISAKQFVFHYFFLVNMTLKYRHSMFQ